MKKLLMFSAFVLALLCAGTVRAQTVHYIDYASGSNSNAGTSEGSPWKSHPYMACGSPPTYTHTAGDTFIFKGGVTWPAACFTMNITQGGSSNTVRDTYTVDQAWFTGGSFTKPVFSGSGAALQSLVEISASNVTMSYLDMGQENITSGVGGGLYGQCASVIYIPTSTGYQNITVSYSKLHDWNVPTAFSFPNHGLGGMCVDHYVTGGSNNIVLDHSEIRDDGAAGGINGVCAHSVSITNSRCIYLQEGIVGHDIIAYNEFGWLYLNGANKDTSGEHTNVIEADTSHSGDGPVYGNYIHDSAAFGETIEEGAVCQVYNNVIYNVENVPIRIGGGTGATTGDVCSVHNNTIYNAVWNGPYGSPFNSVVYDTEGTGVYGVLNIDNNLTIGQGFSAGSANVVLTVAQANADGITPSSLFALTTSDPSIVNAGVNLTSSCSGLLAALCSDPEGAPWYGGTTQSRPNSAWTVGAYVFPPGSSSNPVDVFTPTSLTFGTQTTGTSSSPQTVTLQNTGSSTDAISSIRVTGANASQFTETNTCPSALSAGSSCTISVTFSPSTAGSLSASISITDTVSPGGSAAVSLMGTGQAPGLWTLTQVAPYVESASSATCVLTFPANPATGSTVAIGAVPGPRSGDTLTAVDSNGNSYTLTAASPSPILTGAGQAYVWRMDSAPSNASKTVTITDSTATPSYFDCGGANFQVASGYTPSVDLSASAESASANPLNVPSLTPSTAQEAMFFEATPGNYFSAIGAPWTTNTIFAPNVGAPHWGTADGYATNQSSAVTPNLSSASPGGGSAVIVAFQATATGSTPTISSLSITSGNEGASVTITGTNFGASQGASTVQINSTAVTCGTWSATSLVCTIPTPATTGGISVTTTNGTSNSVTFTVTPHLASLSVTSGPVATSVTFTGTGFGATQGTSTATFNGTAATPSSWSDTSIVATVPAAATTGSAIVTQGGNASNAITFTVTPHITSLSPTSGVVGAGVTISGTTFGSTQGSSTVKFNGTTATCTTWSATSLSCPVPTSATTGNVVVNVSGNNSNGVSFTVNAPVSTPVIASVSPNVGLAGTTVTITGSNFGSSQGTSTVTFNGVAAAVSSWSATSITCLSPAGATTGNVLVTVSAVASNPVPFGVYPYPVIVIR